MNLKWIGIGVAGAVILVGILIGLWAVGSYNALVSLDQTALEQWGQVESVYQRRADLIPGLVESVKGAANFEKDTLTAVTQARAQVGQVTSQAIGNIANDPAAFQRFEQAQQGLSSALSRLMVVVEKYPELKATQGYQDFRVAYEGSENRINVARVNFNRAAGAFNTRRLSFPTVLIAGMFGSRFNEKPFFKSEAGAEKAPEVKF